MTEARGRGADGARHSGSPTGWRRLLLAMVLTVFLVSIALPVTLVLTNDPPDPNAAPGFTLSQAQGGPVTLSDFQGRDRVVLVFYRGFG